jgi:hypothetical protein
VLNSGSSLAGGVAQGWKKPGSPGALSAVVLHIAEANEDAEIWRRFGGGSDRNRALLGNKDNSMHGMQIAQCPINTGDSVSC